MRPRDAWRAGWLVWMGVFSQWFGSLTAERDETFYSDLPVSSIVQAGPMEVASEATLQATCVPICSRCSVLLIEVSSKLLPNIFGREVA